MIKSFKPVLFTLNDDPSSQEKLISFLEQQGLEYKGKQNRDKYGFSRENVFRLNDFELVVSWMRNLSTIKYVPNGWGGAFTEVYFDNIRKSCVGYTEHDTLAFCQGEHEILKLAIPVDR